MTDLSGSSSPASTAVTTTATTVASEGPDTKSIHTAELRTHVERCERLVSKPQLLERLPDHGEGIRQRLARFKAELSLREADSAAAEPLQEGQREGKPLGEAHANSTKSVDARAQEDLFASNAAAIMTRHKDRRVSVAETVRKMYGGSLSEREIERIIADVPDTYFLTYAETVEREKEMAKQARHEELIKLRQQAAPFR